MRKKSVWPIWGKRTMYFGLFLGICLIWAGCVKPVTKPGITNTPAPAATGSTKPTPEPVPATATPVPDMTGTAVRPTTVPTTRPTEEPGATLSPSVTPTGAPEATPSGTQTPLPEENITGVPTVTTEPTVTTVPLPTPIPEYDTLLQNGWQRTEDFFGCREIFFSGKFDDAEPVIGEDSYEFCYRSVSDVSVLFRIIGEEEADVETFLEELRRNRPECHIEQEGLEDYSYAYVDGKTRVDGRIYACRNEEKENRMRVEFYSPADSDFQTEGYGFYLR